MEPKAAATDEKAQANTEYEERVAFFSATKKQRGDDKHAACKHGDQGDRVITCRPIVLVAKKAIAFSKPRFVFTQIHRAAPSFLQHIYRPVLTIYGV